MDESLDISDLGNGEIRELIIREHYSRKIFVPVFIAQADQEIDQSVYIQVLENISRKPA